MSDQDTQRWLTMAEVTKLTGYHRATIYRLIREGKFPAYFNPTPNSCRFSQQAIHDWMAEKEAAA